MRIHLRLLALLALLAGCTDGLGLDEPCATEMYEVRIQRGPPDARRQGAQAEVWIYDAGPGPRVSYEFDWSSGSCRVTGPVPFSLAPHEGAG